MDETAPGFMLLVAEAAQKLEEPAAEQKRSFQEVWNAYEDKEKRRQAGERNEKERLESLYRQRREKIEDQKPTSKDKKPTSTERKPTNADKEKQQLQDKLAREKKKVEEQARKKEIADKQAQQKREREEEQLRKKKQLELQEEEKARKQKEIEDKKQKEREVAEERKRERERLAKEAALIEKRAAEARIAREKEEKEREKERQKQLCQLTEIALKAAMTDASNNQLEFKATAFSTKGTFHKKKRTMSVDQSPMAIAEHDIQLTETAKKTHILQPPIEAKVFCHVVVGQTQSVLSVEIQLNKNAIVEKPPPPPAPKECELTKETLQEALNKGSNNSNKIRVRSVDSKKLTSNQPPIAIPDARFQLKNHDPRFDIDSFEAKYQLVSNPGAEVSCDSTGKLQVSFASGPLEARPKCKGSETTVALALGKASNNMLGLKAGTFIGVGEIPVGYRAQSFPHEYDVQLRRNFQDTHKIQRRLWGLPGLVARWRCELVDGSPTFVVTIPNPEFIFRPKQCVWDKASLQTALDEASSEGSSNMSDATKLEVNPTIAEDAPLWRMKIPTMHESIEEEGKLNDAVFQLKPEFQTDYKLRPNLGPTVFCNSRLGKLHVLFRWFQSWEAQKRGIITKVGS